METKTEAFMRAHPELAHNEDVVAVAYGNVDDVPGIVVWVNGDRQDSAARVLDLVGTTWDAMPIGIDVSGPVALD